jgi:hypothetical protein
MTNNAVADGQDWSDEQEAIRRIRDRNAERSRVEDDDETDELVERLMELGRSLGPDFDSDMVWGR